MNVRSILALAFTGLLVLVGLAAIFGLVPEPRAGANANRPPDLGVLYSWWADPSVSEERVDDGDDLFGSLGGFAAAEAAAETEGDRVFATVPRTNAIGGKEWTYLPRLTDPGAQIEAIELAGEGSSFLEVDAQGEVRGTPPVPEFEPVRRWEVTLGATILTADGDREVVRQLFSLDVAERPYWLGLDRSGRDVLVVLAQGAGDALYAALLSVFGACGLGILLGAHSGYLGGRFRDVVDLLSEGIESVPAILVLILVAVASGYAAWALPLALSIVLLPEVQRTVADEVGGFRRRQFVEGCREMGMTDRRILWVEIVRYNLQPLIVFLVARVAGLAVLMQVVLAYLNLASGDATTFGEGLRVLTSSGAVYPWIVWPSLIALLLTLLSFRQLSGFLTTMREGTEG